MGCGSSKTTAVENSPNQQQVQGTRNQPQGTSNQPEGTPNQPQGTSNQPGEGTSTQIEEQPQKKGRIPRGNLAKYSKLLAPWGHVPKRPADADPNLDEEAFPLQPDVEPEDLTPWRDEDTRIECSRVVEKVEPYFWDFSDNAQKKADEIFRNLVARSVGDPFLVGTWDCISRSVGGFSWRGDEQAAPLNPESTQAYFISQLRHPATRCCMCIQGEMHFKFDISHWWDLQEKAIEEDALTARQEEVIERRSKRTDLDDPERMRRRRIVLIKRFLKRYSTEFEDADDLEENELHPWLGWADRMHESWQKFQDLMTVNQNDNKNADFLMTRTDTLIK